MQTNLQNWYKTEIMLENLNGVYWLNITNGHTNTAIKINKYEAQRIAKEQGIEINDYQLKMPL